MIRPRAQSGPRGFAFEPPRLQSYIFVTLCKRRRPNSKLEYTTAIIIHDCSTTINYSENTINDKGEGQLRRRDLHRGEQRRREARRQERPVHDSCTDSDMCVYAYIYIYIYIYICIHIHNCIAIISIIIMMMMMMVISFYFFYYYCYYYCS